MARNTATPSRRTASQRPKRRSRKLSQRGTGIAAVAVAVLVLLAGAGFTSVAALAGAILYWQVKDCRGPVAGSGTTARRLLRALCWAAVAAAVALAAQGWPAPGGATLGLALAAGLATALKLTSQRRRG